MGEESRRACRVAWKHGRGAVYVTGRYQTRAHLGILPGERDGHTGVHWWPPNDQTNVSGRPKERHSGRHVDHNM